MRTPIRWVGVAVMTSATLGGAAAMMYVPASSSAATKPAPLPTPSRDLTTPAIASIANQALQLSAEIVAAQSELARLQQQVVNEAATRYYQPSAAPLVRVQSPSSSQSTSAARHVTPSVVTTKASKRPVTHTTTGASGKSAEKENTASKDTISSGAQGDN